MKKRVAQISVEHLILFGIVIAILIPSAIIFYSYQSGNRGNQDAQITNAGNTLINDMNDVKSLGPKSWKTTQLTLPSNVLSIYSSSTGNEIVFRTSSGDKPFFLDKGTKIFVSPDLKFTTGTTKFKLSVSSEGKFCLSNFEGDCPQTRCVDSDRDGYTTCDGDCNDDNPSVHPGAVETCNKVDDNCDGKVDEAWDKDNDGWIGSEYTSLCEDAYGTTYTWDCNDEDPAVYPGAAEICDGKRDDCLGPVGWGDTSLQGFSCSELSPPLTLGRCEGKYAQCRDIGGWGWKCMDGNTQLPAGIVCSSADDNDCNGVPDNEETRCALLFSVDYNSVPDQGSPGNYEADYAAGERGLVDTLRGVAAEAGANDTGVVVSWPDLANPPSLKYFAEHNVNLASGSLQLWIKNGADENIFRGTKTHDFWALSSDVNSRGIVVLKLAPYDGKKHFVVEFNTNQNTPPDSVVFDDIDTLTWWHNNDNSESDTIPHLATLTWAPDSQYPDTKIHFTLFVNGGSYRARQDKIVSNTKWPQAVDSAWTMSVGYRQGGQATIANAIIDELSIAPFPKEQGQVDSDFFRFAGCDFTDFDCPDVRMGDVNQNGCVDLDDRKWLSDNTRPSQYPDGFKPKCIDFVPDCRIDALDNASWYAFPEIDHCIWPDEDVVPSHFRCVGFDTCAASGENAVYCANPDEPLPGHNTSLPGQFDWWCTGVGNPDRCGPCDSPLVCQETSGLCGQVHGGSPIIFKGSTFTSSIPPPGMPPNHFR